MKLIYKVEDKPQFHQLVIFAFQQLLAIMAATIAVPLIIKNGMNTAAALLVPVLVPLFMLHLLVRRARYFWVLLLRLLVRCPLRLLVLPQ